MSHTATRKSVVSEEKEKETENPVKDMKKKMAANAEKERQVTDKQPEKDKTKQAEKPVEKAKQSEKPADKSKHVEKSAEKPKQVEKSAEKPKQVEKSAERPKQNEKSTDKSEKSTVADKKVEKNGVEKKADSKEKKEREKKDDKLEKSGKDAKKPKQNGSKANGVETNGVEEGSDDDVIEICDDEFPELAYEDSDNESPTPDNAPGRSLTRRSQVKATRTPETPQPAAEKSDKPLDKSSDKQSDKSSDKVPDKPAENASSEDSKEPKLLKATETLDRKLRSADSPKPESKKDKDSPKTESKKDKDSPKKDKENGEKLEVVVEIEVEEEPRKTDTNYSKSRVKVSPYRRSMRLADQTTSSVMANYTGNNTTMEMDITESSIMSEEPSMDDSYLNGLKSIRGRRSYKPLKEMTFKHVNRSVRSTASGTASEISSRPTGTVVGRKRKPEGDETVEIATEAGELSSVVHSKRMRLLDRIAQPFRRTLASTPLPARRNAEIVGINTDLPQTVPVASSSTFDPETLKSNPSVTPVIPPPVLATPPATPEDKDSKRCIVM